MSGANTVDCGESDTPCRTLQQVMNMSVSGDTIQLLQDDSQPSHFRHCAEQPIVTNLTFVGDDTNQILIFCDSSLDKYHQMPILFHFEMSTTTFKNLTVTSSHILAHNAKLTFEHCVFNDSVVFLMQKDYLELYTNFSELSVIYKGVEIEIETVTEAYNRYKEEFPEMLQDYMSTYNIAPLTCLSVEAIFHNVEWYLKRAGAPPPIDMPQILGLQAICHNISLTIRNSNVANNPCYLFSLTSLCADIRDTAFRSPSSGSAVLGGLNLQSFSFPSVTIEHCVFVNIKYDTMAYTQIGTFWDASAALTFGIRSTNDKSHFVPPRRGFSCKSSDFHLNLSHITFKGNLRAVAFESPFEYWRRAHQIPCILIQNSTFANNQLGTSGAAVYIDSPIYINIQNCYFLNNRAGVNPFNGKLRPGGESVKVTTKKTIAVSSLVVQSGHLLIMDAQLRRKDFVSNKTIFFDLKGNGGAIAVQNASFVHVLDCHFENNSANNLGGAIYFSVHVGVTSMNNTSILSGDLLNKPKAGLLLHSSCKRMLLENVSFVATKMFGDKVSVLEYSSQSKSSKDARTALQIDRIKISCPENSRLLLQNSSTSTDIVHFAREKGDHWTTQHATFADMFHTCEACSTGYYSLGRGHLELRVELSHSIHKRSTTNESPSPNPPPPPPPPPPRDLILPLLHSEDITQIATYEDVKCSVCPFGGLCTAGIKAKANYWGMRVGDNVEFYHCPSGYCCSEAVCPTYNTCNNYRTGTLCSKCKSGYSEAIFSTDCIPSEECNHHWLFPLYFATICLFALILLFQSSIETFLFQFSLKKNKCAIPKCKTSEKDTMPHTEVGEGMNVPEEGTNVSLILLFYYFQDASLIHFTPIYAKATDPLLQKLTHFASGLFDFQVDITAFIDTVCPFPNLGPVEKISVKLLSVPVMYVCVGIIFVFSKLLCTCPLQLFQSGKKIIQTNATTAVLLATLFSYQSLASSAFTFLYCVPLGQDSVMFVHADTKCFQIWQIFILLYVIFAVVPFALFLMIAPSFLKHRFMNLLQFYCGCFCPFPAILWLLAKNRRRVEINKEKRGAVLPHTGIFLVCETLQGPFKECSAQLPFVKTLSVCWSGVALVKRLALVLLSTYVHNIMVRLLFMTLTCFLSFFLHISVQPYKKKRDNMAETASHMAVFLVCIINLIRAIFEVAEVVPDGPTAKILNILQLIEDSLLLWLPLLGASALILLLIMKFFGLIFKKCVKC